jgi:hypothetical protein
MGQGRNLTIEVYTCGLIDEHDTQAGVFKQTPPGRGDHTDPNHPPKKTLLTAAIREKML